MAIRDDYLLRMINLLREAIAEMLKLRQQGRYEAALHAAFAAQERLFGRRTEEISKLSLEELLRLLTLDEPPPVATEKIFAYGSLLHETGRVYQAMGREQLASGCYQLALQTMLTGTANAGGASDERWNTMRELLAQIPPDQLYAPVKELLERVGASGRSE